jgi:HAD superfamily hydrolase (TIGR01549 family)
LCDLDDTLFDHAFAARSALASVLAADEAARHWPFSDVEQRHSEILEILHTDVVAGRLSIDAARKERFHRLLSAFGATVTPEQAAHWAGAYRRAYQEGWRPVEGAVELLQAARDAGVPVAVVTNNLREEQVNKLEYCGMTDLVAALVTSEETGFSKPSPEIFHEALARVGAKPENAVMLGDGWSTDVEGARASGIRPVWFNRRAAASPDSTVQEIRSLVPAVRVLSELLAVTSQD